MSSTGGSALTIGDAAQLARVTVRTLHHYDAIGLLRPSERTESGYRLYGQADLERLQVILFYRELGFALADVRRLTADPSFDRRTALLAQRALLLEKANQTAAMLETIEAALTAIEKGGHMDRSEMFEVFGDFDPAVHEPEAEARWGQSDAYRESSRRVASYSKDDWKRIRAEGDAIERDFAELLATGVEPADQRAMDVAERHRLLIDRWYYSCSHEMHAGLGAMYVDDPRFADRYERRRPGLAVFVRDAIRANADRAERRTSAG